MKIFSKKIIISKNLDSKEITVSKIYLKNIPLINNTLLLDTIDYPIYRKIPSGIGLDFMVRI